VVNIDVTPEPVDAFFNMVGSEGFWKRFGVIALGGFLVVTGTVIAVSGAKAVKDIGNAALAIGSKVVTKGAV